ncbi:MAG: preprotein translocase subunit SecG [Phycisphaerae bacterium]|nr:preprotein translocase subunit SecG [Phycisphaerae bacterium]
MIFPLALSFLQNLVIVLFVLICVAIILIVLLQKGRGGGIGAAFGGGGAGSLLGTKTGDFLTWVTICLVAAFLVLAVLMGKFLRPATSSDLSSMPSVPGTTTSQPATTPPTGDISMPDVSIPDEAQTPPVTDEPSAAAEETTEEPMEPTN